MGAELLELSMAMLLLKHAMIMPAIISDMGIATSSIFHDTASQDPSPDSTIPVIAPDIATHILVRFSRRSISSRVRTTMTSKILAWSVFSAR